MPAHGQATTPRCTEKAHGCCVTNSIGTSVEAVGERTLHTVEVAPQQPMSRRRGKTEMGRSGVGAHAREGGQRTSSGLAVKRP